MGGGEPAIIIDWGTVASILTVVSAIAGFLLWLHPKMKRLTDMLDDWTGEEARPGVPKRDGVMERLSKIEKKVNENNDHDYVLRQQTKILEEILRKVNDDERSH